MSTVDIPTHTAAAYGCTSCFCSTCVFLLAAAIIAYSSQNSTTDTSKTYNSNPSRTYIKTMIAFGIIGMLLAIFGAYAINKHLA